MRSLRARLFLYLALAAVASSALTVVGAALLTHGQVQRQALTNLERQTQATATAAGQLGQAQYSPGLQVFVVQEGMLRRPPARSEAELAQAIQASGQPQGQVHAGNRDVLFAQRPSQAGSIALVRPSRLQPGDWRPLVGGFLLAGLGAAIVAAALSLLLARRLARPLHDVASASQEIAAGSSEARVPVRGNDELGLLATSFNAMAAQLTEAKQAERAFLMSVSHELKTPLAAIRGYAEALEDHAASLEEAAPVIRTEADRLERLVRDLLDLARLDRHEFTVATDTVDLAAIARQASRRYLPRARELGIELAVNAPQPSPALGDRDRLLQVVSNLVENALRYTPEGGQVTIGAQGTELSVSDTGPGIAAEDLPHVFERFYLHNKHKLDRPVGSGLGLAIVKELVTMMRGQVSVAGATGSGATFTVTLPSVTDNQPQTAQTVTHHAHS